MTDLVFVDTNVLLYALDETNLKKQAVARRWREELWRSRRGRISFQVLQEFYVNVAQKWPAFASEARTEIKDLIAWQPVRADYGILERSWKIMDRFQISFWDAMIVAAAQSASCRFLLTEDLQPNQDLDGVIVVNPFRTEPAELLNA